MNKQKVRMLSPMDAALMPNAGLSGGEPKAKPSRLNP